jgi:hypothetical protein
VRIRSVALHEKAAPPALLHGRRLQREPCKAGWCLGQGREGDRQKREQKMPDLKTKLPTQKHFTNQSSNASKSIHWSTSRPPTRPNTKRLAARRNWHERMPANCAAGCPHEREGAGFSRQRDSEAAGWDTRRSYISMNRAVGRGVARGDGGDPFAEGHAPAGNGKWGGFEYNCSCVLSGKAKPMPSLATK